jgi:tight adherence protein B
LALISMRPKTIALGTFLALVAISGPAAGSPTPNTPGDTRITNMTTEPGQVQLTFSADRLPAGQSLDPSSVKVTSGGTTLPATASKPTGSSPGPATSIREVILTLDTSGSMKGSGIEAARSAALAYAASLPADVRIGLVTFSDAPHRLLQPTTDRAALRSAIGHVDADGNTSLYDGIVAAVDESGGLPSDAQRRLLVLSDGDDTSSSHSLSDVLRTLSVTHVPADVVAFRLPGNQGVLNEIATTSHGTVLPASNAADLAKAFALAAQVFKQQVVVTVQVPNSLAGKDAEITVSLRAGANTVSARTTASFAAVAGQGPAHNTPAPNANAAPATSSSNSLWLTVALAFAAFLGVALIALLVPLANKERTARQARLAEVNRYRMVASVGHVPGETTKPSESDLTKRALSLVDRAVRARGQRERLADEVERAGLRLRPEEWAALQLCAIVGSGAILAVLLRSPLGGLLGGVIGLAGCRLFIRYKITRRAKAFNDQLPDTLQLIAGSLRSGFSLNQALSGVVREGTEPTASEFARALAEARLGADLEDALEGVADRMRCEDLRWVVMAVRISREVGGNLAEVLQNTVETMRERARLRGHVRALSAEGRISAKILIGLPFLMAAYLLATHPNYLDPLLHTGIGIAMLAGGAVLLGIGAFWINRVVKIEV